jgi:hypothetical protein
VTTNYGDGSGERGVQMRQQPAAAPVAPPAAATACCGAKSEVAPVNIEAAGSCCAS